MKPKKTKTPYERQTPVEHQMDAVRYASQLFNRRFINDNHEILTTDIEKKEEIAAMLRAIAGMRKDPMYCKHIIEALDFKSVLTTRETFCLTELPAWHAIVEILKEEATRLENKVLCIDYELKKENKELKSQISILKCNLEKRDVSLTRSQYINKVNKEWILKLKKVLSEHYKENHYD